MADFEAAPEGGIREKGTAAPAGQPAEEVKTDAPAEENAAAEGAENTSEESSDKEESKEGQESEGEE
ncbi:MAG TPA: hypothetical protein VKR52_04550 [Terracidiphilus sp.]|nr:hypothetical protein [Terracidiphilus sp.]